MLSTKISWVNNGDLGVTLPHREGTRFIWVGGLVGFKGCFIIEVRHVVIVSLEYNIHSPAELYKS